VTLSTKPRSSDLAAGSLHAGRYRIMRLLHRGGMSTIYLAEDTKMQGRQIALKELRLPTALRRSKRAKRNHGSRANPRC